MANLEDLLVSEWKNEAENDGVEQDTNLRENPQKEILWAAENGDCEVTRRLLTADPSLVNCKDSDSYTPLHRAAYNNHLDVLSLLLESGADISARTIDDWQPLHSACKWNNARCAAKLLEYGADPNALSKGGLTPLHIASSQSTSYEIIQLLLMNPYTDANIKNTAGELPVDIGRRLFKYVKMFDSGKPLFQAIRREY